ncbi:MAG: efflux RND transporter periplasmic adaptor subunit [Halioglobus sp.]|nr:efflux RND transporter periplasmic adaptor subunit [Halioglobus sp.]
MTQSTPIAFAIAVTLSLISACTKEPDITASEPVAEVTTQIVTTTDLPVIIIGYGTVEFDPKGQRTLTSEIEASVLELTALPGDAVRSGDAVVRLVPSSNAGVDVARARRDANAASAAAERTKRLRADGLASDADVEAGVVAARDLEALAASLESRAGAISALTSPIDGVVDAILVEPGALVSAGTALARIASPGSIQARIGVEIEDVGTLLIGDDVRIEGFYKSATATDSTIRMIDQRVDPATRVTYIYVFIPPASGFLSGQAVRAALTADVRRGVMVAPRQSIFADERGKYVFIDVDGKAGLRRVETGVTVADQTEIVSGIATGDAVVVEGAAILTDGMKIRTNSDPAAVLR